MTTLFLRSSDLESLGDLVWGTVGDDPEPNQAPGALSLSRGSVAKDGARSSGGAVTLGKVVGATPSATWWGFVSFQVNAFTLSGTVTMNLRMRENAMTDNIGAQCIIQRRDASGGFVSEVLNSQKGTEFGTTEAAQNWTATPTSTSFSDGDRICVFGMYNAVGAADIAAVGHLFVDGPTSGASGDSFITFTETITAFTPAVFVPYRNPMPPLIAQ